MLDRRAMVNSHAVVIRVMLRELSMNDVVIK